MITGPQRDKQHLTKSGQVRQTLRRQQHTKMNTSQMMLRSHKKQERQKRPSSTTTANSTREARTRAHTSYHSRSWCPVCVQAKDRPDNHPKQHNKTLVIQCDITYYKAIGEQATSSIFHSRRCRNRHVHGRTDRRQNTKHAIPTNYALNNSVWNVAEHMQCSTALSYSQTMRISS